MAQSGPNGYAKFEAEIWKIFGTEAEMDMNVIFDCAEPTTGAWPSQNLYANAVLLSKADLSEASQMCPACHLPVAFVSR